LGEESHSSRLTLALRELKTEAAPEEYMKENRKLSNALWGDLETDEEKVNFLIAGRGFETGIIAKAIQHEVAMAVHFRSEIMKERKEGKIK